MDEPAVTPLELAEALHRFDRRVGGTAVTPWGELDGRDRDAAVLRCRQALDLLGGKRMTDPSRVAIARLESAAYRISEDVQDAVTEAVSTMGLNLEGALSVARAEGVEWAARELDRLNLIDLEGSPDGVAEALRRMMRNGGPDQVVE